jgi:hypothetical protein
MTKLTARQRKVVSAERKLQLARAEAIQSYADLEQALCALFSYVSDTNPQVAGTIYFKITNSRARSDILAKLLRMKHKDTYNLFFNSLNKMIGEIDGKRNSVIHWHMLGIGDSGRRGQPRFREMVLLPPNFWTIDENTPSYNISSLNQFKTQCDYLAWATNSFVNKLNRREVLGVASPDIFQQPLNYPPPPPDSPLAQKPRSRRHRP